MSETTTRAGAPARSVGARFETRRDELIAAATRAINRRGVRGMTLAEVADACGMATTGVAYYFGRKEDLAAACFAAGLDRLEAMIEAASAPELARERVRAFFVAYFAHKAQVVAGADREIPVFSDMRALGEPARSALNARFMAVFRRFRDLLRAPDLAWLRGEAAGARTHIMLEHVFWLNAWLPRFEVEDYPRLCARLLDVLFDGVAADLRPTPAPLPLPPRATRGDAPPDAFLIAATREVNRHGFKGASVDRISASLARTKGAFYHHASSKTEVVVAGFERTFDILREYQSLAMRNGGDALGQLQLTVSSLLDFQLSGQGPLMRTSALQSLPVAERGAMIWRSSRVADRFAGMVADGVAQRVIRPVDPVVAAQMIMAAVNVVADLRLGPSLADARARIEHYATPIVHGLFAPVRLRERP